MSTEIRDTSNGNDAAAAASAPELVPRVVAWLSRWPQATLVVFTVACLLPFSGKAFHIDDPIFIWTAQQITHHPLDPYGFTATWWLRATPMWQIQQNPPLAAYYMAVVGWIGGWSERALHLGFVLPAIAVVLGTYHLARRFTRQPLLAAAITLVAPGFLVSATGVMCDVMTLALWMLAVIFWLKGLDDSKPRYLAIGGILIAASALTKYFGMSLIPLLFAYSWIKQRNLRSWVGYLVIPMLLLGFYEFYTRELYGYGLIGLAAGHASTSGAGLTKVTVVHPSYSPTAGTAPLRVLVGLAFAGGCALPALLFAALLWSRRQISWGCIVSGLLALFSFANWIDMSRIYGQQAWLHAQRGWITAQLFFYVAGGVSLSALAISRLRKRRDAESWLLVLWIFGTMIFAVFVNWDVNARSLLPMVPAVAILIARRLEETVSIAKSRWAAVAVPLAISGAISLWVATGDMALANTARTAANYIRDRTRDDYRPAWFEGRWGFEYYMESFGARPADPDGVGTKFGDLVVIPRYNTTLFKFPLKTTKPEFANYEIHTWVTAMNPDAGAGFYFSGWGPVPYAFGPVPVQQYLMARVLEEK